MTTSQKRSKSKEPIEKESDKRARTGSDTMVATKDEPTFAASPSTSSAATNVASSSSTTSAAATQDQPIHLPEPIIVEYGASSVIKFLDKIENANKENDNYSHPVIIGSRAIAFWMPAYSACDDWNIVATPSQAIKLIHDNQIGLNIKLIEQPLDPIVIRRRPMPHNVKQAIASLPKKLYKITGENVAAHIKFDIEIATTNDQESSNAAISSACQILKLCHANQADASYMNISLGSVKGTVCVVSPVSLLEALKSSQLYWPAHFAKHVADLHTLRAVLAPLEPPTSIANIGIFADKSKALTPPTRSAQLEELLLTYTLEVEAVRGTPRAHINLAMSHEEDFFGREDDFFVTPYIPHDVVHAMVAYGAAPIYNELKTDRKSKAYMVSKDVFEKAAYDKQIQCVKEEVMVMALERYLLSQLTLDPASAYRSALIRICTTLTKCWFRQFIVDNFPRIAVCDKDLLTLRDTMLAKHPLPLPVNKNDPLDLLRKTITNLDDLHLIKRLNLLTKAVSDLNKILDIGGDDNASDGDDDGESHSYNEGDGDSYHEDDVYYEDPDQNAYKKQTYQDMFETIKSFWMIESVTPGKPGLLVSFYQESYFNESSDGHTYCNHHATLSVQPFNTSIDTKYMSAFKSSRYENPVHGPQRDYHKVAAAMSAVYRGEYWNESDNWSTNRLVARSLEKEVDELGLEGLTEDVLMAFIIAVVQPKLPAHGDTLLCKTVDKRKVQGRIPVSPANQLWFDCWKYHQVIDNY